MNFRPPARVKHMLEVLARKDRTHQTWLLNKLIEDEWKRRGLPPVPDGDDDAPDD